ncbi:MAG: hypothetical protein EPO21_22575 [Chloroflexota bacterium]|nr:MAG: hypothetical protein EPO21_22575 [Chloroflexota bacterium]
MDQQFLDSMRVRLAGRTKRQLIEEMIVRSPHVGAKEKLHLALQEYPLFLLMMARDYPTKIWILDKGERPTSADILSDGARQRRWHSRGIHLDQCDGVVDVIDNYVAMVVSWKTLLIIRHEFAHVVTTFFSPKTRSQLAALFEKAKMRNYFVEPLAAESLGEYLACAMSFYFFPDLREDLRTVDPDLHTLVGGILAEAEEISAQISSVPAGVAGA